MRQDAVDANSTVARTSSRVGTSRWTPHHLREIVLNLPRLENELDVVPPLGIDEVAQALRIDDGRLPVLATWSIRPWATGYHAARR